MSEFISSLADRIIAGGLITREEALALLLFENSALQTAANRVRAHFCGNRYELCAIINAKSGRCGENCRFCAQSSSYTTQINEYPLIARETIVSEALKLAQAGVERFSVVTSGRRLSADETAQIADAFRLIRSESSIKLCVSCGLLTFKQFVQLKEAGLSRYHNNLETSRRFFPEICSTHTIDDKIAALEAARQAGLELCSGGIIGLGENWEDRIDMALQARELRVDSIPLNVLNPIPGTPLANQPILSNDDICKTFALFRLIYPSAAIRLAGGRGLMSDKGLQAFQSGCNAAITGDMLTTAGITIAADHKMIQNLSKPADSTIGE